MKIEKYEIWNLIEYSSYQPDITTIIDEADNLKFLLKILIHLKIKK